MSDFYNDDDEALADYLDGLVSAAYEVSGAWHKIAIQGNENGAVAYHSTNDDEDRGYPSKYANWKVEYKSLAAAMEREGKSRHGIGCEVTVTVNGKKV